MDTNQEPLPFLRRPSLSAVPEMELLPCPMAADQLPIGQLVTMTSKFTPTTLEDRDYDDIGLQWYKDVILLSTSSGKFKESLGGQHLVQKPLDADTEAGTIEAEQMRVRMFKDAEAALRKAVLKDDGAEAAEWLKERVERGEDVGFVTAVREVLNASYKHAKLVDVGGGNWEVVREMSSGHQASGKRRDSGLEVQTGSKRDAVGVVVRKVEVVGGEVKLGEEMTAHFWA